jgi:hypothetical protein
MFYIGEHVNTRLQREFLCLIPKERVVGDGKKNTLFNEEGAKRKNKKMSNHFIYRKTLLEGIKTYSSFQRRLKRKKCPSILKEKDLGTIFFFLCQNFLFKK